MTANIPTSWERTSLDALLTGVQAGGRPKGGVAKYKSGVPSIGGEHLDPLGGFRVQNMRFVPEEFAQSQTRGWIKQGDILVVKDGATTGKTSFVSKDFPYSRALVNEHVLRLSAIEYLSSKYLFYFLWSRDGQDKIQKDFRGTAQGGISKGFASKVEVPVAPSQEQHRIVEAIESYLTRLDDAVASLERVKRNLERYRASVLKAAVEGCLVRTEAELARSEGRTYEPASELLKRILIERKARWIEDAVEKARAKGSTDEAALLQVRKQAEKKYKEPEAPDTTDLPDLPEGWCWTRAEQVCDFITKGTTPPKDRMSAYSGDVPFIKVYNLTFDGSLDFAVDPTFIDNETHTGFLGRSVALPGDVLINIVGPPLGKTAIVPKTFPEWNINQAIARFRPVTGLVPQYLEAVLRSRVFLNWAMSRSKATAGQFNLTLEICRDAPLPIPPLAEQNRIIEKLSFITSSECNSARTVSTSLARSARLRQSILKWAFEGKLVEQDPNDEPASALLERIRMSSTMTNGGRGVR